MFSTRSAILLATFAALLWGLWWIPIRILAARGIDDLWGGLLMSAALVPPLLLLILIRRRTPNLGPKALFGAGFVGMAVTSYSTAINLSDVVRVILLFYLAPAWSKLIETLFLGLPWRKTSNLALVLTLVGGFLVLGGELSLARINFGDLLALFSGMCWAIGAALIYANGPADAVKLTFGTALSATLVGLVAALFFSTAPSFENIAQASPAIALGGLIYVLPILLITMWSAQILPPALLSFLLTAEILSGVFSGVLLLDETISALQILGAAAIVAAAMVELVFGQTRGHVTATEDVGNSRYATFRLTQTSNTKSQRKR